MDRWGTLSQVSGWFALIEQKHHGNLSVGQENKIQCIPAFPATYLALLQRFCWLQWGLTPSIAFMKSRMSLESGLQRLVTAFA